MGITEGGNFPVAIKAVAEWFPKNERAFATGIFNAGTNVGAVLAPILVPIITLAWGWQWAFILTGAIGTLTSLDFLGFGLPAGEPSLGELVAQGKANLQAPWLGISAFAVLALMLSLLVFIGEAARDAFDPRK